MKTFALMFIACLLSISAHGETDLKAEETARQERLSQANDEVQLMDEATPEELQRLFDLPAPGLELFDLNAATVSIDVSIARQSLTIRFPGGSYSTLISSARPGFQTVTGCFSHPHLERMHYSKKYDNAPMPHSMFFYGGYAIHGTYDEAHLGRPASHGCVRVSLRDAAYLYDIVESYGARNTRICVH